MNKFLITLLVALPFFSPYMIGGIHLPVIVGVIASLGLFLKAGNSEYFKMFCPLLVYLWTIPLLATMSISIPCDIESSIFPNTFIVFSIWLLAFNRAIDTQYALKVYKILVLLSVGLFFIQDISYMLVGRRPELYLNLGVFEYYYGGNISTYANNKSIAERSNSFFLEPAHFIQYVFPYFCYLLTQFLSTRKISKELVFVGSAILLSRSGNAFLLLGVVFIYLLLLYREISISLKLFLGSVVIFVTFIAMNYYSDSSFVTAITGRMDELSLDVNQFGGQSGFLRMYRGYFIYGKMDVINKIFGVAPGSFEYVSSQINLYGVRYEGDYVNGIQALLIRGGVIGTALFCCKIIYLIYKNSCNTSKYILVSMIGLFFVESVFLDYKMFLYLFLIYCFNKHLNKVKQFVSI